MASVPGGHCGRDMLKWGHMKLRKVECKLSQWQYTGVLIYLLVAISAWSLFIYGGFWVAGDWSVFKYRFTGSHKLSVVDQ